jgi:hypothetical protein
MSRLELEYWCYDNDLEPPKLTVKGWKGSTAQNRFREKKKQ